ncbi:MAG TPA: hypothetical protein VJW17_13325 [Pyrinomonadaceae bacterium]|nr:hypothetical protein [Pyrinomonadaceae bacterium]
MTTNSKELCTSSGGELYRGVKNMLRCDEAEVVHDIADYVISQHWALRLLSNLIERTRHTPAPGFIGLIGWSRSFLSVKPGQRQNGGVWTARLSNERRAIERMLPFAHDLSWSELKSDFRPDIAGLHALSKSLSPRRIFKLVRRLRRYDFFKALRVIEFIAYYTRYLEIFQNSRFGLAVMSSHSNPHGLAFNLVARKCGVPIVLITHGMPIRPVARLSYDLAVVHCEAARRIYDEEGCRIDYVLTHGRQQDYVPMPSQLPAQLTVAIFLCKDVNEKCLQALVRRLLSEANVSALRIRPHPKNLCAGLEDWVAAQRDPRLALSSDVSVFQDVKSVDLVLAGNSSVLIDAVSAGRPSGYMVDLDHGPDDLHRFVECGLIYSMADESGSFHWNPDSMLEFYQRPCWLNVLRYFANIDEDENTVGLRMAAKLRQLAADGSLAHSGPHC